MKKYRKRPVVVEAAQWFKNGDHPKDGVEPFASGEFKGELLEGRVVRYYRDPDDNGQRPCEHCGRIMHDHGWIDTLEGGHIVCPGDWIITGVKGEHYPCKPDVFEATYQDAEEPVVTVSLSNLKWYRELVDLNPADLAPRLDELILRAS